MNIRTIAVNLATRDDAPVAVDHSDKDNCRVNAELRRPDGLASSLTIKWPRLSDGIVGCTSPQPHYELTLPLDYLRR